MRFYKLRARKDLPCTKDRFMMRKGGIHENGVKIRPHAPIQTDNSLISGQAAIRITSLSAVDNIRRPLSKHGYQPRFLLR